MDDLERVPLVRVGAGHWIRRKKMEMEKKSKRYEMKKKSDFWPKERK